MVRACWRQFNILIPTLLQTEKYIVFFDDNCGLCNRSVQFILNHERQPKLKFASLNGSYAKSILPKFNLNSDFNDSILFYRNGKIYQKSSAVLHLIQHLKWYCFCFYICWIVPRFLRDFIYDAIAVNRHKIRSIYCFHSNAFSDRFLD
jgi:predicted DCC family thiol-disulfide oxidoreductase YuxK